MNRQTCKKILAAPCQNWRNPLFFCLALVLLCASGVACSARQPESAQTNLVATAKSETPGTGKKPAQGKKATAQATKKQQDAGLSPQEALLRSAGRDAASPQPEAGFTLNVPRSIGDGEAFQVEFGAQGAQALTIEWRDKTLALGPCSGPDNLCRALLPVPLDEKAARLPLSLSVTWQNEKKETMSAQLPVKLRKYPVQKLTVESRFVSPPKEVEEKIKRDRAEFNAAISKITTVRYWSLPLLRPVPGEVTSQFGLRRVFNNVPKNPHRGVDFDGKTGDPIAAIESGIVVLVSDHYYSGNIVIVDHGLGVFSSYIHLSAFNVKKGQKISRGDIVGYVGSTGRVTGPHLHLSMHVLGVGVNAAACIDM